MDNKKHYQAKNYHEKDYVLATTAFGTETETVDLPQYNQQRYPLTQLWETIDTMLCSFSRYGLDYEQVGCYFQTFPVAFP